MKAHRVRFEIRCRAPARGFYLWALRVGSGGPAAGLICLLRAGAPPSWAGLPASGKTPQRLRFDMCAVAGPRSKEPRQPSGAVMVLACLARPAPRGHLSRGKPPAGPLLPYCASARTRHPFPTVIYCAAPAPLSASAPRDLCLCGWKTTRTPLGASFSLRYGDGWRALRSAQHGPLRLPFGLPRYPTLGSPRPA